MRKLLMKSVSTVLVLAMLFSLLSVSVFATTEADAPVTIKINDINSNVVNITASAEKEAVVILASYQKDKLVNVKAEKNTLTEGMQDYTIEGFEKGVCDVVKAYVWESLNSYTPLCEALEKLQISASGSVVLDGKLPETGVQIQAGNSISATVPQNVVLEENAHALTLTVTTKENSDSNITLGDSDSLLALDVHIEGVSKENTAPITVDLGCVLATGLNSTAIRLYHVEDGETIPMTYVPNNVVLTEHNQFKYDPETGRVVLCLATFSEIVTVTNEVNAWAGGVDTSWYTKNENATDFTISNADQFAGLGKLVCEGKTFDDKTIVLTNDINMGGEDYMVADKLQFYPIGYTSAGYQGEFMGTFDGAGHKISNVRQNTWSMIGTYSGTYYNAAMGVFGYVKNATIKNLTIDNFSCESEFGTAGVVANCADGICNFENIAIINCKPYTYNNNCAGILATDGGDEGNAFSFKNITIDNTNTIGALWGTWDGICSGIMCSLKAGTKVNMENCHVAAKLDVYNDVCGNYQYYWYRYSGMLIGRVRNTVKWNGYDIPDLKNVTAKNCTVNFGDWNDYYYCELVDNSLASYTHDHQFSRLTRVDSVDVENKTATVDGVTTAIPTSGRANYVVVNGTASTENAICYHFKDGEVWNHEQGGYETTDIDGDGVVDSNVLKEDKQHIYLPFNQLFTGTGWGIRGIDMADLGIGGITIEGVDVKPGEEESVCKFKAKLKDNDVISNTKSYAIGDLFENVAPVNLPINDSSVMVSITSATTGELAGTYTQDPTNWTNGTIKFKEGYEGVVKITIQDYQFCTPTTIYVNVVGAEALDVIAQFNQETGNTNVGIINFEEFLTKEVNFQ